MLATRLAAEKSKPTNPAKPVKIKVAQFYNPNNPEGGDTQRLIQLMRTNPEIRLEKWGGITLPSGGAKAALMMSIAGDTAPDLGLSWFHIVRNEIKQGFLYPLNEWIGDDTNGNGQIDDDEAKWEGWKKIKPLWRRVATINGKVYAVPWSVHTDLAIIYRVDMIAAAGLNPNKPPATWGEFLYWCQKLTDPNKKIPGAVVQQGQKAIAIPSSGYQWLPWIQSQGGAPIVQIRKSPKTGKEYEFSSGATSFITPDGEDLTAVKPQWHANFASKEGMKAAELIYKLRWMKWMINPKNKEPINLSAQDIQNHFVMVDGEKLEFSESEIITGVGRPAYGQRGGSQSDLLGRGEVAMTITTISDLTAIGSRSGVDPSLLSWKVGCHTRLDLAQKDKESFKSRITIL
ncbi:MAG: extracellular solute-binding protein [Kiritimatiellaeota bacterium]|nr:extracellular solute-binding protein [Kiritimatiellota bacterium]